MIAQIANLATVSLAMASKADGFAEFGRHEKIHGHTAAARRSALERAVARSDCMTVSALEVVFFVDRVGIYLGDQCVMLATLSKTIERTAHD